MMRWQWILLGLLPKAALAELEVSLYSGQQSAPASDISIQGDATIPESSFRQSWEGRDFVWPIYGGLRVTKWRSENFGWGLDYAHNKVEPPSGTLPFGFSALEFTDGLNTWTVNAYYRWPEALGQTTPYVGAGLGISVPGVEINYLQQETFNYQLTGPAATWLAGVRYPVNDRWSVFAEYKGTYTENRVDLIGGGILETDIVTNAFNIGFNYGF